MKPCIIEKIEASHLHNSIAMTVGSNKLQLYNGTQWLLGERSYNQIMSLFNGVTESSDVDMAASEIMLLTAENERLKNKCAKVERELREALEMKRVSLALVRTNKCSCTQILVTCSVCCCLVSS